MVTAMSVPVPSCCCRQVRLVGAPDGPEPTWCVGVGSVYSRLGLGAGNRVTTGRSPPGVYGWGLETGDRVRVRGRVNVRVGVGVGVRVGVRVRVRG